MSGFPIMFGTSDRTYRQFRHIVGKPDFQTRSAEVSGRDFFPVYKEASSQSRSVYHWSSLNKLTYRSIWYYQKDYFTRNYQPTLFLLSRSYAPYLISFYPQNYHTVFITYLNPVMVG